MSPSDVTDSTPPPVPTPLAAVPLRLAAVAVVAAIVGVVVGGGASYFLVRHFDNSSPGQVVIRNVTSPGSPGSVSVPALQARLGPSLVEVIREPAAGAAISSADVGSGFLASTSGLIVTGEGAVAGASGVEVALSTGQILPATIAAADPDTGVVVLQVSSSLKLPPPLTFASTPPANGDVAVAVSTSLGNNPSIEVGAVSTIGLTMTVPDLATASGETVVDGVLRTNTAPPLGSTGGPLVDSAGQVIGILTGDSMQPLDQGTGASASGFALDASAAAALVGSLSATGAGPPALGLVSRWLDPASGAALGLPQGVQVVAVDPGSAAAQAGIQQGDVITSLNGAPAWSAKTTLYPSLADYLATLDPGTKVAIAVYRNGANHPLSLTLPAS
ncbi:MAG: S1C family serine protease [Candidatus Dormibacteria bacterium]